MFVALSDRSPIPGDCLLRAVQRFDLVPVPSTLELLIRFDVTLGTRLADGSRLYAGQSSDPYTVLKIERAPSELIQSLGGVADVMRVTAVLEGFASLAWPQPRAIVKEGRSLGEIYRSCGATARVRDDIATHLFVCPAGDFATPAIARVFQEEGAVPVWAAGSMSFIRYRDLFLKNPVDAISTDTTIAVASSFRERHEVPWAISTDAAGNVVQGRADVARGCVYLPRTPQRILENMTRCLVVRRRLTGTYAPQIRAGDAFDVAGDRHVVVTAAHLWSTGADGGAAEQTTTLWLGQLQQ